MTTQSEQTIDTSKDRVEELMKYLANRLFCIENFHLVYSELGLHYNKVVDPNSSQTYFNVVNLHKGFFVPVQESLRATLTVELNSYIVSKDRDSLGSAIDQLKNLAGGPNLMEDYANLKHKNANTLKHVKEYRNKYYAHKSGVSLTELPASSDKGFQDLFVDIKNLLNKAQAYFGSTTWFIDDDSRESVKDTHDLMDNLLRGEGQRISEINVKYISDSYRYGRKKWMETE